MRTLTRFDLHTLLGFAQKELLSVQTSESVLASTTAQSSSAPLKLHPGCALGVTREAGNDEYYGKPGAVTAAAPKVLQAGRSCIMQYTTMVSGAS